MGQRHGPLETLVTPKGSQTGLFGGIFDGRRVFVTGHTGFKGSWLTAWLLSMGAEVTGYALEPDTEPALFDLLGLEPRITHHVADVRDLESLSAAMAAARPEIVLHLAAQPLVLRSYAEPVMTFETNVMGTVNVLEAARGIESVRVLVNVTSDKCYENRETEHPYAEDDAMGGYDPYSASKGAAEIVTAAYRRSFFSDEGSALVASGRAGNVIGGGDWASDRIVPDCVRALAAGEPVPVRNPLAIRPWQHVLEPLSGYLTLAAALYAGKDEFAGGWNFGPLPASALTVREVVEAVIAAWGSGEWQGPRDGVAGPHEAHFLRLDITKAAEVLGWSPVWDAARAIRETTEWYRDFDGGASAAELTEACVRRYVEDATREGAVWAS